MGLQMRQLLSTLCVGSSLALGISDLMGGFHLQTLSFGKPHGDRGTCFGYDCHIS
jgi:hypothetical protein